MKQEKEQWIEEIMNSLDGSRQTKAPHHLQQRILNSLTPKIAILPAKVTWGLAAGLALLVTVNVYSVFHFNNPNKSTDRNGAALIANEYFNNNINL